VFETIRAGLTDLLNAPHLTGRAHLHQLEQLSEEIESLIADLRARLPPSHDHGAAIRRV
jgi:hypothetical protein